MRGGQSLFIFLRGLSMGAADIIPGVSGGTIALITGIYPRLIAGVDHAIGYTAAAVKRVARGAVTDAKDEILRIDFALFIPLFAGIAVSFLSLSHLIHYLLEHEVALLYAFFFGLILASALFVLRNISVLSPGTVLAFAGGAVFAFLFVGMNPIGASHSLPVVFFSGAFAICAMLLPGISGSFLLVFLGQYEFMLAALTGFRLPVVIAFIAGAAGGLAAFARIIDYLLTHHRPVTLSFITGLMAGSLRLPVMKITSVHYSLPPVILLGAVGFAVVFILEFVFREKTAPDNEIALK